VSRLLVLKLGGELVETASARAKIAAFAAATVNDRPLVIVHGGGRAIDAELNRRGVTPKKIDGLRITDATTLEVVVGVLAGVANTGLVAALVAAGVRAVGLTGVDDGLARATRAGTRRSSGGEAADLGFVGDAAEIDPSLVMLLTSRGFVPVLASIGIEEGRSKQSAPGPGLLNVNADVMACRLAAALGDCDLAIAGATAGVLDREGRQIPLLDRDGIDAMMATGAATAGMVAKLDAARAALSAGVASVRILDGRSLDATHGLDTATGTRLVTREVTRP
jgi:acetylglutamate kinase